MSLEKSSSKWTWRGWHLPAPFPVPLQGSSLAEIQVSDMPGLSQASKAALQIVQNLPFSAFLFSNLFLKAAVTGCSDWA